jgi:phosphoglycolate phosphatase
VLLVLWDIDGTLVDTAPHGSEAFAYAMERVTGRKPEELVPMGGRTDLEIALHLLEEGGVEDGEGKLAEMEEALHAGLVAREEAIRREGRALPGAREALERLAAEPGVVQSLLTGNIERNAAVKLGAFGLDRFLDFEVGAYGSDHRDRGELVAVARDKAERKLGRAVPPEDVVLVGDTPLDVAAARRGGARVVGVATGRHDARELHEAGADSVLPDLLDTDRLLAALGLA